MLPRLSGSNLQQIQFRAARLHCGALARSLCEFVCECQSEWQTQRRRKREREEGRVRLVVFLLRRFCSSSIRIAFQYINIYTQVNLHTAEKRIRRSHSDSHSDSRSRSRSYCRCTQHATLIDKLEMKIYEAAAGTGSD